MAPWDEAYVSESFIECEVHVQKSRISIMRMCMRCEPPPASSSVNTRRSPLDLSQADHSLRMSTRLAPALWGPYRPLETQSGGERAAV
eukprot:12778-Eustigmatos_ZCMA.PRE.1